MATETNKIQNSNDKNISGGFYYDLIDRQINLEKKTVFVHVIRHIVNESGIQDVSDVSVTYSPQYEQLVFHKVNVIHEGKIINQLLYKDIKSADEESEAPAYLYNGKRRSYILLKNVQKDDLIDIEYSIIGFNPVFKGLYSSEYYFNSSTTISNYSLSFITTANQKLNYKLFNGAVAPVEQRSGSNIIYQWKNPTIDYSSNHTNVPGWYTASPYATVSEFSDWKQVNDWALSIFNDYQNRLPAKIINKISEWKKQANGDQDLFANLALRYVQDQIRYVGLEMGPNSHQPHPPAEVIDHGFGDCKDKALLLTTILRYAKIDAYVALVNTVEKANLSLALPSTLAFDHAIVALKRGTNYIFIDPTQSLQRGELINNYIPAYSWALVVQPEGHGLTEVEPGFMNRSNIVETLKVSFDGPSYLKVTTEYKGGAADDTRNNISSSSLKEIQENYVSYYRKLFDGAEADSAVFIVDDSVKNVITIVENYKIPKIWEKNADGKLQITTYAKLIASKLPDPANHQAKDPVGLDFPYTMDYILRLEMPDDWNLNMKETHIKNSSYQFDFTPVGNGSHLTFKYYFKSFKDNIPADELAQYKEDYNEIENAVSLSFTYSDPTSPPDKRKNGKPVGNTNWTTTWICLFFGVLLTMLFNFFNKKSLLEGNSFEEAISHSGWIIFLGITLGLRFVLQTYTFFQQGYFTLTTWNILGERGGSGFQAALIFEMCLAMFIMIGSLALIYWHVKKRDIFPKMFIWFVLISLTGQLFLLLSYYALHASFDLSKVRELAMTQFMRSAVYAVIWISFVRKSENVKQVFVIPYNA